MHPLLLKLRIKLICISESHTFVCVHNYTVPFSCVALCCVAIP